MRGHVFLIIGPTAAGKNTLMNKVLLMHPGIQYIPSFTTRPMRDGELPGRTYHYVSVEDFQRRIGAGEFFEYQNVHGHLYGTSRKEFTRVVETGAFGMTDIDILGGLNIKREWPEYVTTVFVRPSDPRALAERLRLRNSETKESLQRRLARIPMELELESQCEHVVVNDDLEQATVALNAILHHQLK